MGSTAEHGKNYKINENSWNSVLFYDPTKCGSNLESWLVQNRPSIHINKSTSKSIVVLHPNLNVSEFKKANHRNGMSVPAAVRDQIISGSGAMNHDLLLTMAKDCNAFEGFWFLSCKDAPKDLVKLWDSYFIKIARDLCAKAAENKNLEFVKIEARWNRFQNSGIIMISNDCFLSESVIEGLATVVKDLIHPWDAQNGGVSQSLSYKPQFYLNSGMDPHFSHRSNTNIHSKDLTTSLNHRPRANEMVENWLLDYYSMTKPIIIR